MENITLHREFNHNLLMADNPREVKFWIDKGVDVNHCNEHGHSALFFASNAEVAQALIAYGADVNHQDKDGETPLFSAFHDADVVKLLIKNGANINHKNNKGETVLFKTNNLMDVVRLINAGCNPFIKNRDGLYHYSNMKMKDRKLYAMFIDEFKKNIVNKSNNIKKESPQPEYA